MAAVHYYLGRPARVWISAQSPRRPARPARTGSRPAHSGSPGQPATGSPLLCPPRPTAQPVPARAAPATRSPP